MSDPFRAEFDELLDEANAVLSERTRDVYEDERELLIGAAEALADHISEDEAEGDPPSPALRRAQRIESDIADLDPEDDDFREDADKLRYRLVRLADQVDFDDEVEEILEGDETLARRRQLRAEKAREAEVELSATEQVLLGPVDDAFEDADERDRFVQYAINYVKDVPPGRSVFHQQLFARTLLSAARLSLDLDFPSEDDPDEDPDDPPVDPPEDTLTGGQGNDTIPSGDGGDTVIGPDPGDTVIGGDGNDVVVIPTEPEDRELVLKLIDQEVAGGNDRWPEFGLSLFRVGATSPRRVVDFMLSDWPNNKNQGGWLRRKLIAALGAEVGPMLPPEDEVHDFVKACKRVSGLQ